MISPNGVNKAALARDVEIETDDLDRLTGVISGEDDGLMLTLGPYTFKRAETDEEFQQIHRLNYQTFVEEVGQYPDTADETLVDKFHKKNHYFVALRDGDLVGMIATHDEPPFSVAGRLSDPGALEALGSHLLEVRLFAVRPDRRYGAVSRGLLYLVFEYARVNGYMHVIASGIASRMRFYERFGFRLLGPAVGQGETAFVPMVLSMNAVPDNINLVVQRIRRRIIRSVSESSHPPVSLLPGPVQLSDALRRAVSERPVSHRGAEFIERFERVRDVLRDMVDGLDTAIMVGSGTLANEVVAATLAADRALRRGLILNNGEFGRRLSCQAQRFGLDFDTLEWAWGERWDLDRIGDHLKQHPDIDWVWAVHLETSTALMNDIDGLFALTRDADARVCLDCVSSLGALPIDLSRVHLATGVSGKSIGALAGLAFIFAGKNALAHVDAARVPRYFDLAEALDTVGPRFTVSSPLMNALECSLSRFSTPERRAEVYRRHAELGEYVRKRLRALDLTPMVEGPDAAPVITSFRTSEGTTSQAFYDLCLSWGFEISGQSGYLLDRGILQIATMGDVSRRDCARLFARLRLWMKASQREKTPVPA